MTELVQAWLSLATVYVLLALVVVGWLRLRVWSVVGELWVARRALGTLRVGLLIAFLVLVGLALAHEEVGLRALAPLVGAAFLLVLQPWSTDEALGSDGLVRGWCGRRYVDLEEWRLTGDHLRARIRGDWTSARVPQERRAQLRARLEALVPERESAFRQ